MTSRITFNAPALALIAALGATMLSGEATAQEQQRQQENQPEQRQMCRAILSPSTLTAPSQQMPEDVRRQQRIAGKLTLQARLSEDIGYVTEVTVEERSNIQVSLAEAERKQDETRRHEEAREMEKREGEMQYQEEEEMQYQVEEMQHQGEEMQEQEDDEQPQEERRQQRRAEPSQNRVPVEVDVSEAQEGEWKVTFTGEGNQECIGTLRVRGSGPNR